MTVVTSLWSEGLLTMASALKCKELTVVAR